MIDPLDPKRVIFHVDMDCFFASVAVRNDPSLYKQPIVVCHSNSDNGSASISSASYEARAFGIKNGMSIGTAKSLCDCLVVVGYDFEAYERISRQMYSVLLKYTHFVQVVRFVLDLGSKLRE